MGNDVSTTEYAHDPVGRVEASTQRTGGREFTFGYTRDLALAGLEIAEAEMLSFLAYEWPTR